MSLLRHDGSDSNYYNNSTGYLPPYFTALNNARNRLYAKNEDGYTLEELYLKALEQAIEKQKEDNDYYVEK